MLHWAFLTGGLVIIADLASLLLLQRSATADPTVVMVNQVLNAVLFTVLGAALVRETGSVRLAALAGLLAGLLDGVVVGAAQAIARPDWVPVDYTSQQLWLDAVVENVVRGVVVATASAWLSALLRRRQAPK